MGADGDQVTELHLIRSASARASEARGAAMYCEKRRSTSYDEGLGELAAMACTVAPCDQSHIKKKRRSWHSRMWKFATRNKSSAGNLSLESFVPADESITDFQAEPTIWKKLLAKLKNRRAAKDAHKPAMCSSRLDLSVKQIGAMTLEAAHSKTAINCDKVAVEKQQRPPPGRSVYPEPSTATSARQISSWAAAPPIWERRHVMQPSALDLSNLKVTGLRHVQKRY